MIGPCGFLQLHLPFTMFRRALNPRRWSRAALAAAAAMTIFWLASAHYVFQVTSARGYCVSV